MVTQLKILGENVSSVLDRMEDICHIANNIEDVSDELSTSLNIARTSLIDCKIMLDASLSHHSTELLDDTDVKEESKHSVVDDDYNNEEGSLDFFEMSLDVKAEPFEDQKEVKNETYMVPEITAQKSAESFIQFMKSTQKTELEELDLQEVITAIECKDFSCMIADNHNIKVDKTSYSCKICGFSSEDKEELASMHLKGTHFKKNKCSACDLELYEFEVEKHKSERVCNLDKTVICPTCGKTYANKKKLKIHMELHTLPLSIGCDQCSKMYRTQRDLNHHKRVVHIDETFTCLECGKEFERKDYLTRHMKHQHQKCEPMTCTECGKVYANELQLTRHMVQHTKVATIPCDICHRLYREKADLTQHMKQVHPDTVEKCPLCGSTHKNKSNLRAHMKSHLGIKDYTCDLCGKGFAHTQILKRHVEQFHSEKNEFSCHLCEKNFKYKNSLSQHLKIHAGLVEACTCEECGKSFTMKNNLKKHMRRVHKIFQKKRSLLLDIKEYKEAIDMKNVAETNNLPWI